jgi:sterol desaturase/sphingolipid hydroxylase (fatty acid hydroxylase superfamily)
LLSLLLCPLLLTRCPNASSCASADYLLHKWNLGKRLGEHAYHHVYKYADQLNAFSGYSFAPQDGWSQGLALALGTLVVPVPLPFVFFMEAATGLWTLYIHTDISPLPWPLMGCDYHYIHHRYNWYNRQRTNDHGIWLDSSRRPSSRIYYSNF